MGISGISFKDGYSVSYYMCVVDRISWKDSTRIQITDGSINRDTETLMQSADITCINFPIDELDNEHLIRIYMDVSQNSNVGHYPLFTGWASCPDQSIDGVLTTNSFQCYSVLKPAQDVPLPPGWYAPVGTDSEDLIRELLKDTGIPDDMITFYGNPPSLTEALIAEENENKLSMAELIISAIKYFMVILGDGSLVLYPMETQMDDEAVFDYILNDVLETQVKINRDWYNCPNVFRAISGDAYAVAIDDDPDSIFSTISRGREIWAQETNCDLNENESIGEYASRRLKELQMVYTTVSYTRRFWPDLYPLSYIRLHYPQQGIVGRYRIMSQTINLGYNASTSEEVIQIG